MIKEFLQGRWMGHPLHPAMVHVIVACWPAALLFDGLSQFGIGGVPMVRTAFVAIALGLLLTLAAVPSGLADWWDIKSGRPAWRLGLYHLVLNVITAILFAVNLGLRLGDAWNAAITPRVPLLLSIVGVLLLLISGYLGGRMVYEHGTSVARTSKEKYRGIAARAGAHLPKEA